MSREVMKLALEALQGLADYRHTERVERALSTLREALAEQPAQQEPVPCCGKYKTCTQACTPRGRFLGKRDALAEQPVQRTWVGLTHDEIKAAYLAVSEIEWAICGMDDAVPFTRIIEAKLREKNT